MTRRVHPIGEVVKVPNARGSVLEISLSLTGKPAAELSKHAIERSRRVGEFLADLVETVLTDDLVDAVLDDKPIREKRQ